MLNKYNKNIYFIVVFIIKLLLKILFTIKELKINIYINILDIKNLHVNSKKRPNKNNLKLKYYNYYFNIL